MDWVLERLQGFGETVAIVDESGSITYKELSEKIVKWGRLLDSSGIEFGDRVALPCKFELDLLAIIFALIERGTIVVPLDPNLEDLSDYYYDARVNKVLEIVRDNPSSPIKSEHLRITSRDDSDRPPHELFSILSGEREAGWIFFTSGTTGRPKAVLLSSGRLFQKYTKKISKSFITQLFLKLDHLGGLHTLLSVIMNGGTAIHCDSRSVVDICESIERHSVELLPTTPTFLNMLIMSGMSSKYDLSSLRLITYGTEVMSSKTLEEVGKLFPAAILKQTYGTSELGVFSTKSKNSQSRFMKIGGHGVDVKIVDGTVRIKSDQAMLGYLNAQSPFDAEGWYDTGDQALVEDGHICILGRKSEVINVGGEKVHPSEIENHLLSLDNVKEVVVAGRANPLSGQIVTALFVLDRDEPLDSLHDRVVDHCSGVLSGYKIPAVVAKAELDTLMGPRLKTVRL